ncbi:hypothetical protein HQ520_19210, partial [bacterium]|nr:hypothetical protein [bacterium]
MTELRSEETQTSDTISRRTLLKGLGGVGALLASGLTGCERKPKRQIVSYSQMPEYQRPEEVLHYASTWTEGPCPYGMLVKTVDGRPIKIEGNPEMPVNGGASSAAMQASVMGLYNPERLRQPLIGGQAATWQEADRRIVDALSQSWSVVLLTRANLGPSERRLLDRIRSLTASAPQGRMRFRHFAYDPAQDPVLAAGLGEHLLRYDRAKVILSVGCDFLGVDGAPLEAIRQFMERRSPTPDHPEMSRLYVAESSFSQTGATADHRIRLRPSQSGPLLEALTRAIRGERDISSFADRYHLNPAVLAALVEDLRGTRGQALVVAGPYLPPETQAAAMELNRELGAISETLAEASYPAVLRADGPAEIGASLKGRVDALILLGVNPVYDWPLGDFQALMGEAGLTVGHGLALDETLSVCDVALPSAHNLESWNDAAPRPRILSICQPVLAPFFNGRQEFDSLLTWARSLAPQDPAFSAKDWYEYVRELWRTEIYPAAGSPVAFESFWEGVLRTGVYRYRLQSPATRPKASRSAGEPQGLELIVRPHHAVYDGRFACDGLLQELPDPVSKLVWDNALSLSPATAKKQGLVTGDVVDVVLGDGKVFQQAVWVQPGMADGALVATLGYGRTRAGRHGSARGFRITCLDGEGATSGLAYGVTLRKTGKTHELAVTQKHPDQAGRPIVLEGTLEEYRRDPGFVAHRRHMPPPAEIHRAFDYSGRNKWGMAIDLTKCVGCGTCTVACQAENNIPVVGKDEVAKGREMHWIRVDRYFEGEEDDLRMVSQPMP